MPTEAKPVAHYRRHFTGLRLIQRQVKTRINFRISRKVVDGWRNDLAF